MRYFSTVRVQSNAEVLDRVEQIRKESRRMQNQKQVPSPTTLEDEQPLCRYPIHSRRLWAMAIRRLTKTSVLTSLSINFLSQSFLLLPRRETIIPLKKRRYSNIFRL